MQERFRDHIFGTCLTIAIVIGIAALLAGCQTDGVGVRDKKVLCQVISDPIRYNTQNNAKGRFAGQVLAADLHARNNVGVGLGCPGY